MYKNISRIYLDLSNREILEQHPELALLFKYYFEFYQQYYDKIMNITNNNDTSQIFEELLDDYYDQYFGLLDRDVFELTNLNKRTFIQIGKWINNTKGMTSIFDIILTYLAEEGYTYVNPVTLEEIQVTSLNYTLTEDNPYEYSLEFDQPINVILDLLDKIHPAGFKRTITVNTTGSNAELNIKIFGSGVSKQIVPLEATA